MSELLRPCPFCGGIAQMSVDRGAKTRFRVWHRCPTGGGRDGPRWRMAVATAWFDNPDRCVRAWNNRWEG